MSKPITDQEILGAKGLCHSRVAQRRPQSARTGQRVWCCHRQRCRRHMVRAAAAAQGTVQARMKYSHSIKIVTDEPVVPNHLAQRVGEACFGYGALRPGEYVVLPTQPLPGEPEARYEYKDYARHVESVRSLVRKATHE